MSASGALVRLYQRGVDLFLRVDSGATLNTGRPALESSDDIGRELYRAVQAMKDEAYDPECACFDYARLCQSDCYQQYRACTARLIAFDPARLGTRGERLAFWINLYNALLIDGVIAFDIKKSVREDLGFFRRAAYLVGGRRYSADDIEHGILRANRTHFHPLLLLPQFAPDDPRLAFALKEADPRIHCALVCASRSCPPIAVYEPEQVDGQLDLAAQTFVNQGGVAAAPDDRLHLSRIFQWYERDFGGREGVLEFVLRYLDEGPIRERLLKQEDPPRIRFQPYDWSVNRL